jgi:hypothetical protein
LPKKIFIGVINGVMVPGYGGARLKKPLAKKLREP